jgi:hypothetical protein
MAMRRTRRPSRRRAASQADEAIEAANMLKADHDEVAFEKRLKKIAKERPTQQARKKTRK